jgi:hypothetical protein
MPAEHVAAANRPRAELKEDFQQLRAELRKSN